jgi:hypothetical protein
MFFSFPEQGFSAKNRFRTLAVTAFRVASVFSVDGELCAACESIES